MNQGFTLLNQNYYTRYGELDIIAQKNETIHVIEVKLVMKSYIHSAYKLNFQKRKRMIQSTQLFIDQYKLRNFYYQFDLITIVNDQIKHYQNIFNLTGV